MLQYKKQNMAGKAGADEGNDMGMLEDRLQALISLLEGKIYRKTVNVGGIEIADCGYDFHEEFDASRYDFRPFAENETWGGNDRHFMFRAKVVVPPELTGEQVRLRLHTGATNIWNTDNPQVISYVNGKLFATLDMNHQDLILAERGEAGKTYDVGFYAYSSKPQPDLFFRLTLSAYDADTARLWYDAKNVFEAARLLDENDVGKTKALETLDEALGRLDLREPGSESERISIRAAADFLEKNYYEGRPASPVTVYSTGSTHIDVAWKWPLRQTKEKALRSVNTALRLMDRYPEFRFMLSQPQLYAFVEEEAPAVWERIRARVAEGRWEAEGGMWVEPDAVLTSGESLVRQILYGRRYFEQHLGAPENEVLWLPDTFGINAQIAQIMKKSGLKYLMTTKIGWNDHDRFPHDTFILRGIDGSEVLTHFITTTDHDKAHTRNVTYNGRQDVSQINGTWERYSDKELNSDLLTCYGYGDGGGGPTERMLEDSRRMEKSIGRTPAVKHASVKEFFHRLEDNLKGKDVPVWYGELYLEYHRGTLTSAAENKRNNRRAEFLNQDVEFLSVLKNSITDDKSYPKELLDANWKITLLNQFHDILPGSAIEDVYRKSDRQYRELFERGSEEAGRAMRAVSGAFVTGDGARPALAVFTRLNFTGPFAAEVKAKDLPAGAEAWCAQKTEDGELFLIDGAAASGVSIVTPAEAEAGTNVFESVRKRPDGGFDLATGRFLVTIDGNGEISRLYDREAQRELVAGGRTLNHLAAFQDVPKDYDAWNVDEGYERKCWLPDAPGELALTENGPIRATVRVRRKYVHSEITQDIRFYRHTDRIDFVTHIDWHEHQTLLRAYFPLELLAEEATCDIQFGNLKRPTHRNTSWDEARFEVCAHKWADVSEDGYGAALLSDCRYGYGFRDAQMSLTLLKSGIDPNPQADQGEHDVTYSLFVHEGGWREAGVPQEAYMLNCPPKVLPLEKAQTGRSWQLLDLSDMNVFVETVKRAEDGKGIVLRAYENWGRRTVTTLRLHGPFTKAELCSLLEKPERTVNLEKDPKDGWVNCRLELGPYEIVTLRVQ
ncbi:MAG: alpha-mannosidase [Lachnospiraceae bacterium]|jgi:alpha-mannosidase